MEQKNGLEMKIMESKKHYEGEIKQLAAKVSDISSKINGLMGKPVENTEQQHEQKSGFARKEKLPESIDPKSKEVVKVQKNPSTEKQMTKETKNFPNHFEKPEDPKQEKAKKSV